MKIIVNEQTICEVLQINFQQRYTWNRLRKLLSKWAMRECFLPPLRSCCHLIGGSFSCFHELHLRKTHLEQHGEKLGSKELGLMKQNRKGKFAFQGKYTLVKFGQFAEVSDASETESSSYHVEIEDDMITAFEHEEEPVPPVAIVAEEHVPMTNADADEDAENDDESDFERGLMDNVVEEEDDDDEDDYADDMAIGGELSGYDNDDLLFGLRQGQDVRLSTEDLDAFFENVNDVAETATETEGFGDILKATPPTST
uniref:Uncharacterized protein n=1 Tax=Lactuca sativa TaxID=4236 RepID=A0A9R1W6S5_LACSA|nr:hypothetical protein LSAT_V11C300140940 [Lactuca sativa]